MTRLLSSLQMPGWRIGSWWPPGPVMCAPSVTNVISKDQPCTTVRWRRLCRYVYCVHTADLWPTISLDQWPLAVELAAYQYSYHAAGKDVMSILPGKESSSMSLKHSGFRIFCMKKHNDQWNMLDKLFGPLSLMTTSANCFCDYPEKVCMTHG